jgi:hypothetical protein
MNSLLASYQNLHGTNVLYNLVTKQQAEVDIDETAFPALAATSGLLRKTGAFTAPKMASLKS